MRAAESAASWRMPARGGTELLLGPETPRVMAVVNLTPDSFSDGGRFEDVEAAVAAALALEADGAEILDLGAESTRPGAIPVPQGEELRRMLPVIEALRPRTRAVLSIDTRKSAVARACLEAGADWINDVTALRGDPEMRAVARDFDVPVVLMHMRGEPATMQKAPSYEDVLGEVLAELERHVEAAEAAGIRRDRMLVDPGIGFGKRFEDNIALLRGLDQLRSLGAPLLLGASRKRILATALEMHGREPGTEARDIATLAAVALGHRAGVSVHRVHHARYASDFLRTLTVLAGDPGAPGSLGTP